METGSRNGVTSGVRSRGVEAGLGPWIEAEVEGGAGAGVKAEAGVEAGAGEGAWVVGLGLLILLQHQRGGREGGVGGGGGGIVSVAV